MKIKNEARLCSVPAAEPMRQGGGEGIAPAAPALAELPDASGEGNADQWKKGIIYGSKFPVGCGCCGEYRRARAARGVIE